LIEIPLSQFLVALLIETCIKSVKHSFFLSETPPPQLYGRLSSSDGQAILEDAKATLPVVLSHSGPSWQPGLISITDFSIGLDEQNGDNRSTSPTPYLLLHNWQLIQAASQCPPDGGSVSRRRYRVLGKTIILQPGGTATATASFFVRLTRTCERYQKGTGEDVLMLRLTELADYPWIRPLATSLIFTAAQGEQEEDLFQTDAEGAELIRRRRGFSSARGCASSERVWRLKRGVTYSVDEGEEDDEERWEQLDNETVASMPEDEDVNIRYERHLYTWMIYSVVVSAGVSFSYKLV
jgi:hypothetical protein